MHRCDLISARLKMRNNSSQICILLMTAAMLSVGRSGGTQLDIMPDLNGLMVCDSSVVFTCTLQSAPLIAMSWHIDGTPVIECTATECKAPFPSMPSHFTTTFVSGAVTELHLDPVKLSDNYTISCTDGTDDFIVTSVKVGALPLTYSVNTQGDETNITVVSSCVFSPLSSVTFKIQNNNTGAALNLVNGNNVLTPTESVVCTDAENPNCGGSNTAKAKAVLTITTQATGTPTEISIVAVQSDEDLSPPQYIGSYILKIPEAEESDSSTNWCEDNLNDCVAAIVVPIGMLLMIIIAVVIICYKKVYKFTIQFEDDLIRFEFKKKIIDRLKTYGFTVTHETIDRTVIVSTKTKDKSPPPSIEVDQFIFTSSEGKVPTYLIYSCTSSKFIVQIKDLPVDFVRIENTLKLEGFDVSDRSEMKEGILLSISANTGKYPPLTFVVDQFIFTSVTGTKPIDLIYSCTGSKFIVQIKDLPVDFERIEETLKLEGFDVFDISEMKEGILLSISANTGKYAAPTFEVDHFKFTSVPGKKPIDFIYSCTEKRRKRKTEKTSGKERQKTQGHMP